MVDKNQFSQQIEQKKRTYLNLEKLGETPSMNRIQKLADRLEERAEERRKNLAHLQESLRSSIKADERGDSPMKLSHDSGLFPEQKQENLVVVDLKHKIEELNHQIIALEEEKASLHTEMNAGLQRELELKNKCGIYEKLIEDLESQVDVLGKSREDDSAQQILQIEREFENFKALHEKVQAELSKKRLELERAEKEKKQLLAQNEELTKQLQTAEQEAIRAMELPESSNSSRTIELFEKKEAELQSQIRTLNDKLQLQTKSFTLIEKERNSLSNQISVLNKKVEVLESENEFLKDAQTQLEGANAEVENSRKELATLRKELTEASRKYQDLQRQSARQQEAREEGSKSLIAQLESEIRELKDNLDRVEQANEDLSTQLETERSGFQRKLDEWSRVEKKLKNDLEQSKKNCQSLQVANEDLKALVSEQTATVQQLNQDSQSEITALKQEIASKKKEAEAMGTLNKKLQADLSAEQRRFAQETEKLQKINADLTSEVEALKEQSQDIEKRFEEEILSLKKEIAERKTALASIGTVDKEHQQKIVQLEGQIAQVSLENSELQKKLAALEADSMVKSPHGTATEETNWAEQYELEKESRIHLEREKDQLMNKIDQLEGRLRLEEQQSERLQAEVIRLEGLTSDLNDEVTKLSKKDLSRAESTTRVEAGAESLKEELERLQEERDNYAEDLKTLKIMMRDKDEHLDQKIEECRKNIEKARSLESSIEGFKRRIDKLISQSEDNDEKMVKLTNEKTALQEKINKLEQEKATNESYEKLEELSQENKKLASKVKELEAELEGLKNAMPSVEELPKERPSENKSRFSLQKQEGCTAAEKKKLLNEMDDLKQKVAEITEQYEALKAENEKLVSSGISGKIASLNASQSTEDESKRIMELNSQIMKLTVDLENAQSQLRQVNAKVTEETEYHNNLVNGLEQRIAELENANQTVERENQELKADIKKHQENIDSLLKLKENSESQLTDSDQKYLQEIAKLNAQLSDLQADFIAREEQLKKNHEKERQELMEQLKELRLQSEQKITAYNTLQSDFENLQRQNMQINQKVTDLLSQNLEFSLKNSEQSEQLRKLKEELASKEKQCEAQTDEISKLQQESETLKTRAQEAEEKLKNIIAEEEYQTPRLEPNSAETRQITEEIAKYSFSQLKSFAIDQALALASTKSELSHASEEITKLKAQNQTLQESLKANILKVEERTLSIRREFEEIIENERARYFKFEEYICANLLEMLKEASKTRKVKTFKGQEGEDIRNIIPELKRIFLECLESQSPSRKKTKGDDSEYREEIMRLKNVINNMQLDIVKYEDELRLYEQEQIKIEEIFKHAKKTRTVLQPIEQEHLIEALAENPRMRPLANNAEFVRHALLYHSFLNEVVFSLPNVQYPESFAGHGKYGELEKEIQMLREKVAEAKKEGQKEGQAEAQNAFSTQISSLDNKMMSLLEKANYGEVYKNLIKGDGNQNSKSASVETVEYKLQAMEKLVEGYSELQKAHEK